MRLPFDINTRRLWAMVRREFNEIIRDPLYLTLVFLVPPFIMLIFGFGLRLDVEHLRMGILNRDQSQLSYSYIDAFTQSEIFDFVKEYTDHNELNEDLRTSKLRAALIIPDGFQRHIHHGLPTEVQILIDGTIPVRSEITRSYAESIHQQFLERFLARQPTPPRKSRYGQIAILSKVWFNEELRSANFIVPGLIATTLIYYPALLTTLSIVREKESQSILSLYCSPISKAELLLGKLFPYLGISIVNCLIMFVVALTVFDIPFEGNVVLVAVASIIYLFATCSLGMLISVLVNTQVAAILITLVLTILPSFLYSGFFTPLSASTWSMWIIGRFIPTTYYLDVIRGVLLKGTGWEMHWPALLVLACYSLILYVVSFKCFRKRLN